jgi:hypothetical protein
LRASGLLFTSSQPIEGKKVVAHEKKKKKKKKKWHPKEKKVAAEHDFQLFLWSTKGPKSCRMGINKKVTAD